MLLIKSRHWCSGNIAPFQGVAPDSISGWRIWLCSVVVSYLLWVQVTRIRFPAEPYGFVV